MLTDVIRAHLATTAAHHEDVALAAMAEPDWDAAAARGQESSALVEAAERLPQNRRAPLVLPARRAERLAAALVAPADKTVAMTHARAAEAIRALLEDRPMREIDEETMRPVVTKAEAREARAKDDAPPEPRRPVKSITEPETTASVPPVA